MKNDKTGKRIRVGNESKRRKQKSKMKKSRKRERKEEKKVTVEGIQNFSLGHNKMKTCSVEQSRLKQSCCVHWLINGNYGNTVGAVSLLGPRPAP